MKTEEPYYLDVRPLFERGEDPFRAIMEAKAGLAMGQALYLTAPFKPLPLIGLFQNEGYDVQSEELGKGEWLIRFIPNAGHVVGAKELDLRELEPPEPLHRALEAITQLGREDTLMLRTRFRPAYLFEQLDDGLYEWESEEIDEGHWLTYVWRRTVG